VYNEGVPQRKINKEIKMSNEIQPVVKVFSVVRVRGWKCEIIGINKGGCVVQVQQPEKLRGTVFTASFKEIK